jgi:hypothetical protein
MVTPENEEISQTSEVEKTSKKQKEGKNKKAKAKSKQTDLFSTSEGLDVPYENKDPVDENSNQTDTEQSRADEIRLTAFIVMKTTVLS